MRGLLPPSPQHLCVSLCYVWKQWNCECFSCQLFSCHTLLSSSWFFLLHYELLEGCVLLGYLQAMSQMPSSFVELTLWLLCYMMIFTPTCLLCTGGSGLCGMGLPGWRAACRVKGCPAHQPWRRPVRRARQGCCVVRTSLIP